MGTKIAKGLGLLIVIMILPIILSASIFIFGIVDITKVVISIVVLGLAGVIIAFKKKRKGLIIYTTILTIITLMTAMKTLDYTNILFFDVKGGIDGRIEVLDKIKETEGGYFTELSLKYSFRVNTAEYKNKTVKDQITFYYTDKKEPTESIETFLNTINKYKDRFNDYLVYDEKYPVDIYYQRWMTKPPAFTTPVFIKLGYQDEYQLKTDGYDWYINTIIHEYIHGIVNSMMYTEKERLDFYKGGLNLENYNKIQEFDEKNLPNWFSEGVAEYITYDIMGKELSSHPISKMDLVAGRSGNEDRLQDFYDISARIIKEVYMEVGKDGVIQIIKETKTKGFEKVFTEVTGKTVEDYYYLFSE